MEVLKRSLQGGGDAPAARKSAKRAGGQGRSADRRAKKSAARKSSAGDLSAKSKEELYEEAKKLDIEGRSEMSKQELITAIRRSA